MSGTEVSSSRRIRFGLYEVDLAVRELRRAGILVKLQERPFEVLAILVEHPGEVVTRMNSASGCGRRTPSSTSTPA
jgi:DNA-binding response OmpR family regulator